MINETSLEHTEAGDFRDRDQPGARASGRCWHQGERLGRGVSVRQRGAELAEILESFRDGHRLTALIPASVSPEVV